jgi:hypothetical protein
MHLAGAEQKTHVFQLNRLDSGTVETSLRYSESRALCASAEDERRPVAGLAASDFTTT